MDLGIVRDKIIVLQMAAKGIKHKILITIGCLLWIASFYGEVFAFQPYSTIGILLSPVLTSIGLFYWLRYYISTRGHFPNPRKIWRENSFEMKDNYFDGIKLVFRYYLEVWAFVIVFWMGIVFISYLMFGRSDAFKAAKAYCESNSEILSRTGDIKYYGVLVSGSMSLQGQGGDADLSFTIIGSKGNFSANSELSKENGIWTVDDLIVE